MTAYRHGTLLLNSLVVRLVEELRSFVSFMAAHGNSFVRSRNTAREVESLDANDAKVDKGRAAVFLPFLLLDQNC